MWCFQIIPVSQDVTQLTKSVTNLQESFLLDVGQWFVDVIEMVSTKALFFDLEQRLMNVLEDAMFSIR